MKKVKTAFTLTLLASTIFVGSVFAAVPNNDFLIKSYQDYLTNVDNKSKVILYEQQDKYGMPLSWSVVIDNKESVKLDKEDGYYSKADIKLQDVGIDGRKELFFYRYSTGSAGAIGLNIYRKSQNAWKEIFVDKNPLQNTNDYEVKYLGNYQVSFKAKAGLEAVIKLDPQQYAGMEDMLPGISNWIDPVSDYEIKDVDGDLSKEIITTQRVIGVSHPDTIALFKNKYKHINGTYQLVSIALFTSDNKLIQRINLDQNSKLN